MLAATCRLNLLGLLVGFLGFLVSAVIAVRPADAAVGIRVSGGRLVEQNGTPLVLRGINHPFTWFTSQNSSFANIKATGANAVRVVLSGGRWQPSNGAADVTAVINLCKANKLICVLENHDTTGFGEQGGAVALDAAASYWISVQSALTGQENFVILNIGNEPIGNNNAAQWTAATASAVTRLRNAGFQHTIMVDAPNWGQDWQFVMRDTAATVLAADPSRNLIFSIHMYGVFDTAAEITSYINSFTTRSLALCVCEFGFLHSDGDPDEDTILSATQAAGIGNMAWSWSGNGGGVEYLDLVLGFNPAQRSTWGTRYITGANGLSATSREATIYSGIIGEPTPPTMPGTPTASNITSSSVRLSWTASADNVGVTGYDIFRAIGATSTAFAAVGTATTTSFTDTNLAASTAYRYQVRARDAAGNISAFSSAVTVTTTAGTGGNGGCTATYTVADQWPGGFNANVVVTNGATASTGWTVTWTFANGQTITNLWNGQDTPSGSTHSVRNMPHNGNLGPGQTASFGFGATWNGTNAVPTVTCTRS
jgi:mannan endo-1,4-beta-mannosidase